MQLEKAVSELTMDDVFDLDQPNSDNVLITALNTRFSRFARQPLLLVIVTTNEIHSTRVTRSLLWIWKQSVELDRG